jgi:hypothetical protein
MSHKQQPFLHPTSSYALTSLHVFLGAKKGGDRKLQKDLGYVMPSDLAQH